MVLYVFGVGFYGFKQQGIFTEIRQDNSLNSQYKIPLYEKSGLSQNERLEIKNQVIEYMLQEKPYLNPDLNIRHLADQLNVSVHKLSQTINQELQKSFFEFINDYRIDEAVKCLKSKDFKHYSIIAIAYECGFNSKTSFYNIFKKHTSQTPSEFRESLLQYN